MRKLPVYPVDEFHTIREIMERANREYGPDVAMLTKIGGKWREFTFAEIWDQVKSAGTALWEQGLRRGDKVAVVGENSAHWAVGYLAAACAGLVVVPMDKELKEQEFFHILHLAEVKAVFAQPKQIEVISGFRERLPNLKIVINTSNTHEAGAIDLDEWTARGAGQLQEGRTGWIESRPNPDDLLAILFTSGTMGNSKGVVLTHNNVCTNAVSAARAVNFGKTDVMLSVLPMHHVYEATCGFIVSLVQGSKVAHAESLKKVGDNMQEIKPTIMLVVPLLLAKLYDRILDGIAKIPGGPRKVALGKTLAGVLSLVDKNARRKIFKDIHAKFGGRIRLLVAGGAAMDPRVSQGLQDFGFTVLQGYGLSETSPLVAVNREVLNKPETVGPCIPGVEVKIHQPDAEGVGEILVKGPNVMKGYYKNEEATREILDAQGWLYTGDTGIVDKDGCVQIKGRKKLIIVTPNGKNINPEEVEDIINRSPYILESMVYAGGGANLLEHEVRAVVVPNVEYIDTQSPEAGREITRAQLEKLIRDEVFRLCDTLADYKRVKKVLLRDEEFPKTSTKKIKRHQVMDGLKD